MIKEIFLSHWIHDYNPFKGKNFILKDKPDYEELLRNYKLLAEDNVSLRAEIKNSAKSSIPGSKPFTIKDGKLFESFRERTADIPLDEDEYLLITDKTGNILEYSESVEKYLHFSREQIIGSNFANFIAPQDIARAAKYNEGILIHGVPVFGVSISILDNNGNVIPAETSGASFLSEKHGQCIFFSVKDKRKARKKDLLLKAQLKISEQSINYSMEELLQLSLDEAEFISDSSIAFFHFVEEDQKTIFLQMWSTNTINNMCKADGKGKHYNIDEAGVWVQCVAEKKAVIHNDYASLKTKKGLPEGHSPIIRELVIPIVRNDKVVAIIGVGNKVSDYTDLDVETLLSFSNLIWDIIKKKNFENDLQQSDIKFTKMVETSSEGFLFVDFSDTITFANKQMEHFLSYTQSELLSLKMQNLLAPEDIKDNLEIIMQVTEGKSVQFEGRLITKAKTEFWAIISVSPIKEENGTLTGRFFAVTDITERKNNEKLIKESEQRFSQIAENSSDWIWEVDLDGLYTYSNSVCEVITGFTPEELVGKKHFYDLFPPDMRDAIIETTSKHFRDRATFTNFENTCIHKNGKPILLLTSAVPVIDDGGNFKGYRGVDEDITERRKTEEAFKSYFKMGTVGMCVATSDRKLIEVNERLSQILGYTEEELLDISWVEITHPDDLNISIEFDTQIMNGTLNEYQLDKRFYRKDGKLVHTTMCVTVQRNPDGSVSNSLVSILDITEKKESEIELIRAKESAEETARIKANILANMSHEIRTPMIAILGYSEMLAETLEDNIAKERALKILSGGKRLLDTLNLILDLSQLEAGKLKPVAVNEDLVAIINEVVGLYKAEAEKKNLFILFEPGFKSFDIKIDRRLVYQIVNNLINNALKYTIEGGVIVGLKINVANENEMLITVKDTGIGIADEHKELIFEEFRQVSEGRGRAFEGPGLGLSLTKKFTEKLGGTIRVESKINEGSNFIVSFPTNLNENNREKTPAENDRPVKEITGQKRNPDEPLPEVLMVENEAINAMVIREYLQKNFKVTIAKNARIALELLKSKSFNLILMDINLGAGMSGIELTKMLKSSEEFKHIPIIAMTAFALIGDKEEFLESGCDDYISKPFTNSQIIEIVNNHIK